MLCEKPSSLQLAVKIKTHINIRIASSEKKKKKTYNLRTIQKVRILIKNEDIIKDGII